MTRKIKKKLPVESQAGPFVLKEPFFWESAWSRARESSLFGRERSLSETIQFWNRRAENFQRNTGGERGRERVNKVLGWIERQGGDLQGCRVLDIGAGPGAFSLAFAGRGGEVVALEPAGKMVSILKEKIDREGLHSITVVPKTWEEVDIAREGWDGYFDLVFASMSPGINNRETLEKALRCARKHCYISAFAGKRENDALMELWKLLFDEEMPPWPGDIMFILNYLYTRGFELSFRVWEEKWTEEAGVEEAADNLCGMIRQYGWDTSSLEQEVSAFVQEKASGGLFTQEVTTRLGQVLVNVGAGFES